MTSDRRPIGPFLVTGAVVGFLAGLFGVGGGFLIVPALVLGSKMHQRLAHGTSLAAVVPISIASASTYVIHGNVDLPVAFFLAIGGVLGAIVGTKLLHALPHRTVGFIFATVLVIAAVRLFLSVSADGRDPLGVGAILVLIVVGLVTGVLAGLLGIGGGIVMVPTMILLLGVVPVLAKGTSALVTIPTAGMGTWRNRRKSNADLRAAGLIGASGIVTAAIGGTLSARMSADLSNVLFATLLSLIAAQLLVQLYRER